MKMMNRFRAFVIILSAVGFAPATLAQLPASVRQPAGALGPDAVRTLNEFVSAQITGLTSGNLREAAAARKSLLFPLTRQESNRTFRVAYASALVPRLSAMADDQAAAVGVRVNALHVLGQLGTDDAVTALKAPLGSNVDAVRYAASLASERTMSVVLLGQSTLDQRVSADLTRWLRDGIGSESNPLVLRAMVSALAASPQKALAVDGICTGLERQIRDAHKNGPNGLAEGLAYGLKQALDRYIAMITEGGDVSDAQRSLLTVAGMAIVHASSQGAGDQGIPADQVKLYQALVQDAENVLNVVLSRAAEDNTVTNQFNAGNYAQALVHAETSWIAEIEGGRYGIKSGDIKKTLER